MSPRKFRPLRYLLAALALLSAAAVLSPRAQAVTYSCVDRSATQVGTAGHDVIHGTPGNDVIVTLGGDDWIDGADGNDLICAGDGNDTVYGGRGNDRLHGFAGNDYMLGGPGVDAQYGGPGNDRLIDNTLEGAQASDYDKLYGNDGDDLIDARAGTVTGGFDIGRDIDGNAGNDTVYGSNHGDSIRGSSGNDKLYGFGGHDEISGGIGDDYLAGGGDYYDSVNGDAGNDTCKTSRYYAGCEHL